MTANPKWGQHWGQLGIPERQLPPSACHPGQNELALACEVVIRGLVHEVKRVQYTTDDYRSIDIRLWQKEGLLYPNKSFTIRWFQRDEIIASINVQVKNNRVILNYNHQISDSGEDWQKKSYPVYLTSTACHLGGKRPWFLCPAQGCTHRVAILYGGSIFACRHCYQLTYRSQRVHLAHRMANRAEKIRGKLGWQPGFLNGAELKPKGMHWKTFQRLYDDHEHFSTCASKAAEPWFRVVETINDD